MKPVHFAGVSSREKIRVSVVVTQGSQMIYAITLILLVLSSGGHPRAALSAVAAAPARAGSAVLVCDPLLRPLFAPPRPVWGRYDVCVADAPLTAVLEEGFTYAAVERLEALDALGAAGTYDRARLAQLFSGRRAEVRRGWKQTGSRFESVTCISPYPDASLTHLHEGTMIIRWTAER